MIYRDSRNERFKYIHLKRPGHVRRHDCASRIVEFKPPKGADSQIHDSFEHSPLDIDLADCDEVIIRQVDTELVGIRFVIHGEAPAKNRARKNQGRGSKAVRANGKDHAQHAAEAA